MSSHASQEATDEYGPSSGTYLYLLWSVSQSLFQILSFTNKGAVQWDTNQGLKHWLQTVI